MLANRLSVLLAERGLSIKEVVDATGVSRNTISNLTNNPSGNINTETTDILCNYLQVTPQDFFEYSPFLLTFINQKSNDVSYYHSSDNLSIRAGGEINNCLIVVAKQGDRENSYPFVLSFLDNDADQEELTRVEKFDLYIHLSTDTSFGESIYDNLSVRFKRQVIGSLQRVVEFYLKEVVLKSKNNYLNKLSRSNLISIAIQYDFYNDNIMSSKKFDISKSKFIQ